MPTSRPFPAGHQTSASPSQTDRRTDRGGPGPPSFLARCWGASLPHTAQRSPQSRPAPCLGWGRGKSLGTVGPRAPSLDRRHLGLRKSWVQSEGWRPVSGVTSAPPGGLRLSRFNQLCALIHSPVHPGGTCSPHAPPVFWGAPPPSGPLPFPARHAVSLTGVRGSHAEPHPHTSPWPGLGLENHLSLHPPDW